MALFGMFVFGAASASMLASASQSQPLGIAQLNKIIGMGHNVQLFDTPEPDESDQKTDVQGATHKLRSSDCTDAQPVRKNLATAVTPQLRKLAEYEQVCGSRVAQRVMFFVGTPKDVFEAQSLGSWVATVLQDFASRDVQPLVILEPTLSGGGSVDFTEYRNGTYDAALDAYFATIKKKGITDEMMGIWVPFPEGNIPVWNSVDPNDFAANVTKTVQIQKKHFPGSKASVLLESKSYPSADSWAGGTFGSLVPYVQNIPKGLIDSFGLQGFAWPPTAEGEAPNLDPKTFLRIDFATEAARTLGVQDIWLNTGTYGVSYVLGRDAPRTLSPESRQTVLNGVVAQARTLRKQGFDPAVHIFAKDKSALTEGIDWSYWPQGEAESSDATSVLKTLVGDLQRASIPLWLFDSVD